MIHLTLTGPLAGLPLCQLDFYEAGDLIHQCKERIAAADPEATYAHAAYTNLSLPNICPACRAEWDRTDEIDEG